MLRCTYIVLIHNNESNIIRLVNSLKKISGNFHKEFIFVDDGSSDNSLKILKEQVNDIARTTIITQEMQGSSISINKALSLVTGDYIHFVEGNEILEENSTNLLIDGCLKSGAQVALGQIATDLIEETKLPIHIVENSYQVISTPINEILINKIPQIQNVGKSGSLVHSALLDRIGRADSSIYTLNISLSLRCAKYSKFVLLSQNVTYINNTELSEDIKFINYNHLKAIYNFSQENLEIVSKLSPELLMVLSRIPAKNSCKIKYLFKSFVAKYIKSIPLSSILTLYKQELEKLF